MDKTLSDKVTKQYDYCVGICYPEDDVKEAIKEFVDYVCEQGIGLSLANDRKAKAKEIFGERLI